MTVAKPMTRRLRDEEIIALVAAFPGDPDLRGELAWRTYNAAARRIPNPEGVCPAGLRVYLDGKGAYSSGYIIHKQTHSTCEHGDITWDDDSEQTMTLKTLVHDLFAGRY